MLVSFQLFGTMSGHFADDCVSHAFHEKHSRGEMTKVVNPQIFDPRQITDSPKPLSDIPGVRLLEFLDIFIVVLVNESSESIFLPDLIAADIYDYLLGKKPLQVESNPKVEEILFDYFVRS